MKLTARASTSPRLRGEVGNRAQRGFRVMGEPPLIEGRLRRADRPLTPTLSPQAGRGSNARPGGRKGRRRAFKQELNLKGKSCCRFAADGGDDP